jgi:galactokinase
MTTRSLLTELPDPARRALDAYRGRVRDSTPGRVVRMGQGARRDVTVAWAPGRVNLIGEHTDYNQGYVLPVAVDRVVALAGEPAAGRRVRLYSLHHDRLAHFPAGRHALLGPPSDHPRLPLFARYVRAVLAELAALPGVRAIPAFDAAIAGDVPVGGGMSSSAALTVACATFAAALGGPALPPMETALLCQRAEQAGAGVRIGIMDQAASCLGRPDHALLLDCRTLAYEHIPINLPGVAIAVYDTGVPRSLAASGYNERRAECEAAVALLAAAIRRDDPARAVTALRDVTLDDLAGYGPLLPDLPLRRARHVVTENARVLRAAAALRTGDARALGALLYASHASLRDDYDVSCAELDAVVAIARTVDGVLGARLMGAGFGGSALILTSADALPALEAALAREYPARTGRIGVLHVCRVAGGPVSGMVELDI